MQQQLGYKLGQLAQLEHNVQNQREETRSGRSVTGPSLQVSKWEETQNWKPGSNYIENTYSGLYVNSKTKLFPSLPRYFPPPTICKNLLNSHPFSLIFFPFTFFKNPNNFYFLLTSFPFFCSIFIIPHISSPNNVERLVSKIYTSVFSYLHPCMSTVLLIRIWPETEFWS